MAERRLLSEAVLKYHLDQETGVRNDAERDEHPQKDAVSHQSRQPPLGLQARSFGAVLPADAALLAALPRIHHRVGTDRRRRPLHSPSSTLCRPAGRLRAAPGDAAAARARPAPRRRRLPVRRPVGRLAGSRRRRLTWQLLVLVGSNGNEAGVRLALRETVGWEYPRREVDGPLGTAKRCVLLGVDVGYDDRHDERYGNHQHGRREEHACHTVAKQTRLTAKTVLVSDIM